MRHYPSHRPIHARATLHLHHAHSGLAINPPAPLPLPAPTSRPQEHDPAKTIAFWLVTLERTIGRLDAIARPWAMFLHRVGQNAAEIRRAS